MEGTSTLPSRQEALYSEDKMLSNRQAVIERRNRICGINGFRSIHQSDSQDVVVAPCHFVIDQSGVTNANTFVTSTFNDSAPELDDVFLQDDDDDDNNNNNFIAISKHANPNDDSIATENDEVVAKSDKCASEIADLLSNHDNTTTDEKEPRCLSNINDPEGIWALYNKVFEPRSPGKDMGHAWDHLLYKNGIMWNNGKWLADSSITAKVDPEFYTKHISSFKQNSNEIFEGDNNKPKPSNNPQPATNINNKSIEYSYDDSLNNVVAMLSFFYSSDDEDNSLLSLSPSSDSSQTSSTTSDMSISSKKSSESAKMNLEESFKELIISNNERQQAIFNMYRNQQHQQKMIHQQNMKQQKVRSITNTSYSNSRAIVSSRANDSNTSKACSDDSSILRIGRNITPDTPVDNLSTMQLKALLKIL